MPLETKPVTVNLGPQHPSTHGVFRMRVTFDGEEIVDVEPVFGYLHRGSEKLAEERTYSQIVTLQTEWIMFHPCLIIKLTHWLLKNYVILFRLLEVWLE